MSQSGARASLQTHGFIVLLNSIGNRLNRKRETLDSVDVVVKEIVQCIESIDEILDARARRREHSISKAIFGHIGTVSALNRISSALNHVVSTFGEGKATIISNTLKRYSTQMIESLRQETGMLGKVESMIYPNNKQLIEMQMLRNLDLFLYSEIYFELISVQKRLRIDIGKYLEQFGLIDATIDDVADISEDLSRNSYNVFLIKLSEKMRTRGYPDIPSAEVLAYVKRMGILRDVHSMLMKYRRGIQPPRVPKPIEEYLKPAIEGRYSLLLRQASSR